MDYRTIDQVWRALISGGLFLASLGLCLWIYWASDARQPGVTLWRAFGSLAVLLTLPSLVISAFLLDNQAQGLINPFFYLSLVGAVATVAVTAGFSLTQRAPEPYEQPWLDQEPQPVLDGNNGWPPIEPAQPAHLDPANVLPQPANWQGNWMEGTTTGPAAPTIAGAGVTDSGGGNWAIPSGSETPFAVSGGSETHHVSSPRGGSVPSSKTVMLDVPQAAASLAYLVERNGPRAGRPHLLAERTLVGRGTGCELRVDDPTMTERHASVRLQADGAWLLTDLDSANGSFVLKDGPQGAAPERVQQHRLSEPDVIRLGAREFIFMEVREARSLEDPDSQATVVTTPSVKAQDPEATVLTTPVAQKPA